MEVTIEETSNLGRKMTVTVPAEQVEQAVAERLKKVAGTVRIDGFRPGKVPLREVKMRFGNVIREEVQHEQVKSSIQAAFEQNNVSPAGQPNIEITKKEADQPFEYVVSFDVFPKVELAPFDGVEIVRETVEIKDIDVERTLKKLRDQHAQWEAVDRPAKEGDQIIIDFVGTIDGEVFEGGSAQNVPLVLGSKSMIPGFEDQLIDGAAGSEVDVKVTFPEEYHATDLSGKEALFKTTITEVKEKALPALDDAFAERVGIREGGMAKLREELKRTLKHEAASAEYSIVKRRVMDKLLGLNPIELPKTLVDQEYLNLQQQALERIKNQLAAVSKNIDQLAELANLQDTDSEKLRAEAERRVALGLLLSEVIQTEELQLDTTRMRSKVEEIASMYEDPKEAIGWLYNDRNRLAEIEGIVMEEQIVDRLLEKANITEISSTYDKVITLAQQDI